MRWTVVRRPSAGREDFGRGPFAARERAVHVAGSTTLAVSVPAQWMRPTGSRNTGPNCVITPGAMCAP